MSNIIFLILCFIAGMLMQRAKLMPDNAATSLNSFIIHIPVPALALLNIHELKFSSGIVLVVVMAWLHFILAAGFFWLVDQYLKSSRARVGALILTGGMGNTAFGLPMIEAYYGQKGIATGLLIDQGDSPALQWQ